MTTSIVEFSYKFMITKPNMTTKCKVFFFGCVQFASLMYQSAICDCKKLFNINMAVLKINVINIIA